MKKILRVPYSQWKIFVTTRTALDFHEYSNKELSDKIFYQKRLFPNENDIDTKQVHIQRATIIRLLKKEFPKNFVGGLKNDLMSLEFYADCISDIEGSQHVFLEAMRKCGICIYTKGLVNSPGWTLPEFLSQGKCIVSERLKVELPVPLENNIHLIFFDSNEHLIQICRDLITNKSEINRLGANARKYYEAYVTPSIFMENIIKNSCY